MQMNSFLIKLQPKVSYNFAINEVLYSCSSRIISADAENPF